MTVGMASDRIDAFLDTYNGAVDLPAVANVYVQLHTGDPGAAGTANVSAETTRVEVTFGAASNGTKTSSNTPQWAGWDAGAEALTHISLWDAATSGNFLQSGAFSSTVNVADGNTLTISSVTLTAGPVAA